MPKRREFVMRGTTKWWSPYDISIQKKYGVFLTASRKKKQGEENGQEAV